MSKEYWCFESESGETSFLAGVVDVLSDNLSLHCTDYNTLDTDVFYIPNQDISQLNEAVKKRMRSYYSMLGGLNTPEKIEALDFHLIRKDCEPSQYIIDSVKELSKSDAAKEAIKEFVRELEWHLQKPICIYEPTHMTDKNLAVLELGYIGIAWRYFFIAFEDYMVLMIIGTSE